MPGPVRRLVLPLLLLSSLALAAPASAATALRAGSTEPGWVRLDVMGTPGVPVRLAERSGATETPLRTVTPDAVGRAAVARAARWGCPGRARTFVASTDDGPPAEATIRTPSCARRLTARVSTRRPRAGRRFALTVADAFRGAGERVAVCLVPARGPERCREVRLRANRRLTPVGLRAPRPGRWRLRVAARGWSGRVGLGLRIRPHARGPLRLVATGDSMIQLVDHDLARALGRGAHVRSDAHISTGISKPTLLNWPVHAARQARRLRADVTVVFLGANDGFNFRGAPCCGRGWVGVYAAKARGMMAAYARGGAAQVYWLTLPAPRSPRFRVVFTAVNAALARAAASFRGGEVRLLRMDRYFTPGFRFRARMRVGGRLRTVRQGDGVHLNATGAALAARLVVRALRADGVL